MTSQNPVITHQVPTKMGFCVIVQGWVVGSFQEISLDLHELLADAKLRARGFAWGWEGGKLGRSLLLHEFWRELSLFAAKAVSSCLLGKVSKLGEGCRQAAKHRAWAKHEEARKGSCKTGPLDS